MKLSVIIPVLNEAAELCDTLSALRPLRADGHEVIVVDGGSRDAGAAIAAELADRIVHADRGRARQMNAGAQVARGDVLLFLHADTRLPPHAAQIIFDGLRARNAAWGRFDVRLSGAHPLLRVVERMMNWRSRVGGIATGDQAIFVRRELFAAIGGFPEIPLMEDVALSKTLKRHGRPLCLAQTITTSSRRWEAHGVVRTIVLMWRLRLAYALGADPRRLARVYYRNPPCDIPLGAS
jgi:rSAM/selenodomain-associated transferase 2